MLTQVKFQFFHSNSSAFQESCAMSSQCTQQLNDFVNKEMTILFDSSTLTLTTYMIEVLKVNELQGNMPKLMCDFLNDGKIVIRYRDIFSRENERNNGVPQGSVLSLTLFLMAINNRGVHLTPHSKSQDQEHPMGIGLNDKFPKWEVAKN